MFQSPDYYSSEEDNYEFNRKSRGFGNNGIERNKKGRKGYRERSRSRDYDRDRGYIHHQESEYNDNENSNDNEREREKRFNKIEESPNNTIMIRGLASHITETDVSNSNLIKKSVQFLFHFFFFR